MSVEQMLRASAEAIDWPATPGFDLQFESERRPRAHWRRSVAIAFAALLLLAGTAMAIPSLRDPVLDWLGLRSVHIERVPRALLEAPGSKLGLGERTTLARARSRLEFTPLLPTGLGAPTVYYESFPPGGRLALVHRGGRVLLTEVQGSLERRYLYKFLRSGTAVDRVRIDGGRGLWIHGQLHQYVYADRTGRIRTDSARTAGNVLLWRRGRLLLRLEGVRAKAAALRVASSLRAAP